MNFPRPYFSQFDLRGESFSCYGSDFRGCIDYTFNNQGYRSYFDYDLTSNERITTCLGSSIATGHGIELTDTFGHLVSDHFNTKLWNLGQGCFRSNNQTILEQIIFLANTDVNIEYYLVQFTHINRCQTEFGHGYLEHDESLALDNFCKILSTASDVLENKKWAWILTDYSNANYPAWIIDHPNKIAIDPDSVDFVPTDQYQQLAPSTHALKMLALHPGPAWNREIADLMIHYFHANT